ncbi:MULTISPECIES: MerR family transcriptional regulator [Actinomyces]|nr:MULTISPECIES: MerR family transcriptional regulator [Actinomyces]
MDRTWISITEMSRRCGLSPDTLRWYEKEGLVSPVPRGPDGRRRYHATDQSTVWVLTALREAGMPTSQMRRFAELMAEGATTHGRRITILQEQLGRLREHRDRLDRAEQALHAKITHYEELIAQGLDCTGSPVPQTLRALQASRN